MPRKAEAERSRGDVVGRGTPAGIIRRPLDLPPMRNIKDGIDFDDEREDDEELAAELASIDEQMR